MADAYIFNHSGDSASSDSKFIFSDSQTIWIPDSNNGAYSGQGQVIFDGSMISNSGKPIDLCSSYVAVPLGVELDFPTALASAQVCNSLAVGLKSGVHNFVHSLSLQISNNEVVGQQPYTNLWTNVKTLLSWSADDLETLGATCMLQPDSVDSFCMPNSTATARRGLGICNNGLNGNVSLGNDNPEMGTFDPKLMTTGNAGSVPLVEQNAGRLKRMLASNVMGDDNGGANPIGQFISHTTMGSIGQSSCVSNTTTQVLWQYMLIIPLNMLHDIFNKLPLVQNAFFRLVLTLNTQNTITTTISCAGNSAGNANIPYFLSGGTTITSSNGTCPLMISPVSAVGSTIQTGLCTADFVGAGTQVLTIKSGICLPSVAAVQSFPFSSCRLYTHLKQFTPIYQQIYFEQRQRVVKYNDIFTYIGLQNISPSGMANAIVSQGLSRLRKLYIVPFINASANTSNGIGLNYSPMASPFDSSPSTCSPCAITQLQVMLSGVNVYQEPLSYSFKEFYENVRGAEAINGGLSRGLNSGLISSKMWQSLYRFIVVDLTEKLPENDDIAKSITLSLVNSTKMAIDLVVIVEYERQLTLDCAEGVIVV